MISPDILKLMKADFLTGNFNSTQLAAKYGVPRHSALQFVSRKSCGWKAELIALGKTPPTEAKTKMKYRDWAKIETDFLAGDAFEMLAARYDVNIIWLKKKARQFMWNEKRRSLLVAASGRDTISANKFDRFYSMAGSFVDAATLQVMKMISEIKQEDGKSIKPSRLKDLIEVFNKLHESVKRLPKDDAKPEPPEMPDENAPKKRGRPPTPKPVSLAILAHQPAPTLNEVEPLKHSHL